MSAVTIDHTTWGGPVSESNRRAARAIEDGSVCVFPSLRFQLMDEDARMFAVDLAAAAKNVSYTPATGQLGGTNASTTDRALLARVLSRFSDAADSLVSAVFPRYAPAIVRARASFRPAEIAGRVTSWRKDDSRLHVDSFPSSPTGGHRILRVFTNVNPTGRARTWRIGEPFDDVVRRFGKQLRLPWPGQASLLRLLHVTRATRSRYDALMLQLHDLMKADGGYQRSARQQTIDFEPGTTWLAFTDEVSHAAMAGQFQLEQTFLLPVRAMEDEARSPLRTLERTMGRSLA